MSFSSFLLSFQYPCQTKQATDALVGGVKFYPIHQDLGAIPSELQQSLEDPNIWASFCVDIAQYRDRSNGKDCRLIMLLLAFAITLGVGASKLGWDLFRDWGYTDSYLCMVFVITLIVLLVALDCLMVAQRIPMEKGLRKICEHHREAFAIQGWGLSVHTEIARTLAEGGYTYYYLYVILFLPLSSTEREMKVPTNNLGYTPPSVSVAVSNGRAVIENEQGVLHC